MDICWHFYLPEETASISQVSLCEDISYWPEKHKSWFYGYKTQKDLNAVIWGKKVPVSLTIAPFPSAIEKWPIEPIKPPQPKRSNLSAIRQIQLDKLQEKLAALKASIPPPLKDESVYWQYIDPEIFVTSFQQMALAWNNPQMELKEKFPAVTPFLIDIYKALKDIKLPDELMRDDTKICTGLSRILQYVQIIRENAAIHNYKLPSEIDKLESFLDDFTDRMIEGGNKIFGEAPDIDENKRYEYLGKISDVLHLSKLSTDERLLMIDKLMNDPCADNDNRVELLEGAIKLIWKEIEKKGKNPVCPHKEIIEKHLEEISKYLKELEDTGEKTWQLRIAEEMGEGANNWREDGGMSLLTKEEFAELIFLEYVLIKTTQMDDGTISYEMDLFFKDKDDSFDGHTMYIKIRNKKLIEILLMG